MPLRNLSAGRSARQLLARNRRPLLPAEEDWGPLSEEEALAAKKEVSLLGHGLNLLGAVGSVLDLPNSSVRDLMGMVTSVSQGERGWGQAFKKYNPFDQWIPTNWFNDTGRDVKTGRDLLEKWGAIGPNVDRGWVPDAGDWAGFGLEVATDPLTYVSLGGTKVLSTLGKAAKKGGTLAMASKLATREAAIRKVAKVGADADVWEALRGLTRDQLQEVTKLERKQWLRAHARTEARHILNPDRRLLGLTEEGGRGLEPIVSAITKDELADLTKKMLKAQGPTPLDSKTVIPGIGEAGREAVWREAIKRRLQPALEGRGKWDRLWDRRTAKQVLEGAQDSDAVYKQYRFMGMGPNARMKGAYKHYATAVDSAGYWTLQNGVSREIANWMRPGLRGVRSAAGRAMARFAQGTGVNVEPHIRRFTAAMQQRFDELAETNPAWDTHARAFMTNWSEIHLKQATPQEALEFIGQVRELDRQVMDEARKMGNDITPFDQDFASSQKFLQEKLKNAPPVPTGGGSAEVRRGLDAEPETIEFGTVVPEHVEEWLARSFRLARGKAKKTGLSQALQEWHQKHDNNIGRWGLLVGIAGGETTINLMGQDAARMVKQLVEESGGEIGPAEIRKLETYLAQKWGAAGANLVGDSFSEIDYGIIKQRTGAFRRVKKAAADLSDGERSKLVARNSGRFNGLANWFLGFTPEELSEGLLARSPMADLEQVLMKMKESNISSDAILRSVAAHAGDASVGSREVGEILTKLNLRLGDATEEGALSYLAKHLHPSQLEGTTSLEDLKHLRIPDDLARDLLNYADVTIKSSAAGKIVDFIDTLTNYFKHHQTIPFAAFHVRNFYGGQWQNLVNGMWSPWSIRAASRIMDSKLGGQELLEIPGLRNSLTEAGLEHTEKNATDLIRREIYEYNNYGDRAFNADPVDIIQAGDQNLVKGEAGLDLIGRRTAALEPERTLLQTDPQKYPAGEGYSKYVRDRTTGEFLKERAKDVDRYTGISGVSPLLPSWLGGADYNRGLIPHPLAPSDVRYGKQSPLSLEDAKKLGGLNALRHPLKWLGSRRIAHPSDYTTFQIRGVGGRVATDAGAGAVGEKLSHYIEGLNRIGGYLHLRRKGYHPAEAARMAAAAQVDYSAKKYGTFENEVLRRVFPFYKWQSRMLPHVIGNIAKRPGGLEAQAIRASTMHRREDDEGWVPQRVRDLGLALPMGPQSPEGDQAFLTSVDLPYEGAFQPFVFRGDPVRSAQSLFRTVGGNATPLLRVPYETLSGDQLYTGRNMSDVHGGVRTIMSHVLQDQGRLAEHEANQALNKLSQGANTVLPGSRSLSPVLDNAFTGFHGRAVGQLRPFLDPSEDESRDAKWWAKALLRVGTGVRIADYNIPEEQARELRPAVEKLLDDVPQADRFSSRYVKEEDRPYLTPQHRTWVRLLETINKERREARAAEEFQIREGDLPPWARNQR
jgi:hypothetical protein